MRTFAALLLALALAPFAALAQDKKEPGQKLPGFGYVTSMKDPKFGKSVEALIRAGGALFGLSQGLKIVEEEGDESLFWMELLVESGITTQQKLGELMKEGDEIVAIVVAALKTTRTGAVS